jgi:hypothetical protein
VNEVVLIVAYSLSNRVSLWFCGTVVLLGTRYLYLKKIILLEQAFNKDETEGGGSFERYTCTFAKKGKY